MRLLLCLTHQGLFRNFDSTLRLLAERGHDVHVSFDSRRYPSAAFAGLLAERANLTEGLTPSPGGRRHAALGRGVRAASDYLRYLGPRYAGAPKLRARAKRQVPAWLRWALADGVDPARLDAALRAVERRLPLDPAALAFVRERAPDLVAVSPLFGSPAQLEVLRAARALGVPTCMPVASWDNLTNKGLIREPPDTLLVWNDAQREEAVALHGIDPARVVVTGAQGFDEWFARGPSSTFDEFVQRLGLRPDRPYLLYLGSSSFIAPDEASFAEEWVDRVRADPRLAGVGILLRPHPQNARQWAALASRDDPQLAVHPAPEDAPQQTGRADWSREDYYDSMHHAAAAIGVNTTAMIETAALGRGIHSLLHPQFRDTQEGTLHFAHLRGFAGGLLHLEADFGAHLDGLAAAVSPADGPDARSRRFVAAFVRPHGLERPVTPLLVDALEAAADRAPVRVAVRVAPRTRAPLALEPLAAVAFAAEYGRPTKQRKRAARRLVRRLTGRRFVRRVRKTLPAR